MGIVFELQPRRPLFDATQQQMLHGVEGDGAQPHRIPDGGTGFFQTKVFEEPQDLDILAGTGLPHSCLEQPPEVSKLRGQLPAFERCCLLDCSGLAFQQRQIMQWMEDQLRVAGVLGGSRRRPAA